MRAQTPALMQIAYTVMVAAGTRGGARCVQPVGAARAGPPWSDWITNAFVVSLIDSPPEMATVPAGQLAVAVAGTSLVVPTGSVTGAAAIS